MDGAGTATSPVQGAAAPSRTNLRWLFVGGVIAVGLGAALFGTLVAPAPSLSLIGLLCSLTGVAELLLVGLLFAAALLTGIPGLACASLAVALVHHLRQGRWALLHRAAFNATTHVLA